MKGSLGIFSKVVSHIIPIDSPESLATDLREDSLVQRELSTFAGYLVLRGGRLVALASAFQQVAKHVDYNEIMVKPNKIEEEVGLVFVKYSLNWYFLWSRFFLAPHSALMFACRYKIYYYLLYNE